jgi:hypothetical protein
MRDSTIRAMTADAVRITAPGTPMAAKAAP